MAYFQHILKFRSNVGHRDLYKFVLMVSLLGLSIGCGVKVWSSNIPYHHDLAVYNLTFGLVFDNPEFVSASTTQAAEDKATYVYHEYIESWEQIKYYWRQFTLERTTRQEYTSGNTLPTERISSPLYVLVCPSLAAVIGQDPQTHLVYFVVLYRDIQFAQPSQTVSMTPVSDWETTQLYIWENGISWIEVSSMVTCEME